MFALVTATAACDDVSKHLSLEGKSPPGLIKAAAAEERFDGATDEWALIPVPSADGPKLAPVAMKAHIYPTPDRAAEPLGYLRVGARVARSKEPVSRRDCAGGWYAVRPVGFVCVDSGATVNLEHPVARAIQVEPDRGKPMPYKYAFVRSVAPNYLKLPTKDQQLQ
jgi:hypothetical protein